MKENIEEVVERLEKSINDVWFSTTYSQEDEERDLQTLLSDYKRVLKENEDWQKAYQEEKDKQFELLRENQKLKAENEELKKERDAIYSDYQDLGKEKWEADEAIIFLTERLENSISKQRVQDKIEELKNKSGGNVFHIQQTINAEIRLLQDLLEEKGE